MNFKKTYHPANGYTKLCVKDSCSLQRLEFGILELQYGQEYCLNTENMETALIILSGVCDISFDSTIWKGVGGRRTVFDGKASAAYIPRGKTVRIFSPFQVKIAVCQTPCEEDTEPQLILPADLTETVLGKPTWKRDTDFIIGAESSSRHLFVGETLIHPGNWGGFPPHKHDQDNMPFECIAEEIYFYQFDPSQGFALTRSYSRGEFDCAYVVENNDLVEFPKGYHTVSAAPGYNTYFLWCMAGDHKGFYRSNDPDHAWVASCENLLTRMGI